MIGADIREMKLSLDRRLTIAVTPALRHGCSQAVAVLLLKTDRGV